MFPFGHYLTHHYLKTFVSVLIQHNIKLLIWNVFVRYTIGNAKWHMKFLFKMIILKRYLNKYLANWLKKIRVCAFTILKKCTKFDNHWCKGFLWILTISYIHITHTHISNAISPLRQVAGGDNKKVYILKRFLFFFYFVRLIIFWQIMFPITNLLF